MRRTNTCPAYDRPGQGIGLESHGRLHDGVEPWEFRPSHSYFRCLDYVDMDGAALLASDIATGVQVVNGRCLYPDRPGSGVELLDAAELLLEK